MEQYLLEGYSLEQLRDASARDRLLSYLFLVHHRNGADSRLSWRFRDRFDTLIGLIISDGVRSEAALSLYQEILQEFRFYHHFDDIMAELEMMLKPLSSI